MIAQVLLSAQFIAVAAIWDWVPCEQWNPNVHCYFEGGCTSGDPCIADIGFYSASYSGGYVCDQDNEVYKEIFLNTAVSQKNGLSPTTANEKHMDEIESVDEYCFVIGNEPDSALFQECWKYLGNLEAMNGDYEDDVWTLDECKETCVDSSQCVAISYYEPDAGEASPLGPDGECYTINNMAELDTEEADDGYLFERKSCDNINALIQERYDNAYRL